MFGTGIRSSTSAVRSLWNGVGSGGRLSGGGLSILGMKARNWANCLRA